MEGRGRRRPRTAGPAGRRSTRDDLLRLSAELRDLRRTGRARPGRHLPPPEVVFEAAPDADSGSGGRSDAGSDAGSDGEAGAPDRAEDEAGGGAKGVVGGVRATFQEEERWPRPPAGSTLQDEARWEVAMGFNRLARVYEAPYRQRGRAAQMRELRQEAGKAFARERRERRARLQQQERELAALQREAEVEREALRGTCLRCIRTRARDYGVKDLHARELYVGWGRKCGACFAKEAALEAEARHLGAAAPAEAAGTAEPDEVEALKDRLRALERQVAIGSTLEFRTARLEEAARVRNQLKVAEQRRRVREIKERLALKKKQGLLPRRTEARRRDAGSSSGSGESIIAIRGSGLDQGGDAARGGTTGHRW